jgi:hypothetical protein
MQSEMLNDWNEPDVRTEDVDGVNNVDLKWAELVLIRRNTCLLNSHVMEGNSIY